jgi:hypothetical protein
MYNTTVECTYNTDNIFLETDEINIEEKNFIRDVIYRQELLNILGLEDYNQYKIDREIRMLYEKIKECNVLNECIIKLSRDYMSLDDKIGLIILFSYDYLYLTHNCFKEFFETGKISDEKICKLKSAISN